MIKNETFLNALDKKIDDRRGWTEEFGAIYEEFGADELEEFALWGYEQAEKDFNELLIMCYDVINEYRNNSLGDATINELDRVLQGYPKPC